MKTNWYFWLLVLATLAYSSWMSQTVMPLTTGEIVCFELARSADASQTIINAWDTDDRDSMRRSIYLDFIFIVLYTASIAWGCKRTAPPRWKRVGNTLAAAMLLAGAFDVAENILMLQTLSGSVSDIRSFCTFMFAGIKFLIISTSLLFFAASLVVTVSGNKQAG